MFNNKQIVRNFIFAFFCALILLITFSLTYYVSYYEQEQPRLENKLENEKSENPICESNRGGYFINSIYFKLMAAFFAGGVISEGLWLKIGIF